MDTFNPQNRIKIYCLNANGWTTNKYSIRDDIRQENPDIILIQDHGLIDDNKVKLWNYNIIQQNQSNEHHDGTLIAIKKGIYFTELEEFTEEMLAINIHSKRGKITIATAYQPPRRPYLLREDFSKLFRRQNPVFLLGDLNACCRTAGYTNDSNGQGRNLTSFIQQGLCQHLGPDFSTFITQRSATTPDLVLANNSGLLIIGYERSTNISRSLTILMDISWSPIQIPTKPRKQYHRANWDQYQDMLRHTMDINLVTGDSTETIENALHTIQTAIQQAGTVCIPTTSHRTLPHPTYTRAEKLLIEQLRGLTAQLSNRTATPHAWRQMKQIQYALNNACKTNSRIAWNNKIQSIQNNTDPKKFWQLIKTYQGITTSKSVQYIYGNNREKKYHPSDKNQYFANSGRLFIKRIELQSK